MIVRKRKYAGMLACAGSCQVEQGEGEHMILAAGDPREGTPPQTLLGPTLVSSRRL